MVVHDQDFARNPHWPGNELSTGAGSFLIDDERLERWGKALVTPRDSGVTLQSWLWAPPAKHSTRQIEDLLERIGTLYDLGIQRHFADVL